MPCGKSPTWMNRAMLRIPRMNVTLLVPLVVWIRYPHKRVRIIATKWSKKKPSLNCLQIFHSPEVIHDTIPKHETMLLPLTNKLLLLQVLCLTHITYPLKWTDFGPCNMYLTIMSLIMSLNRPLCSKKNTKKQKKHHAKNKKKLGT